MVLWSLNASRKINFGSLLLTLLALMLIAIVSFVHFVQSPLSHRSESFVFTLAPRTPAKVMIKELQNKGMFNPVQAKLFFCLLSFKRTQKSLKAGEYRLSYDMTPEVLYKKLIKGEVILHSLRLPEACTFAEVLTLLWQHPAVNKVLKGKTSQEILSSICLTCSNVEGMLFPDTYFFRADTSDSALLKLAYQTMNMNLQNQWDKRDSQVILKTPYEVLILASIIEKEASIVEERALISGVFQNRITKKMRLQADPTVIYGLGNAFTGDLTVENLKYDTPYNTYLYEGLPPTPISMPSLQSIHAACHPAKTDKLYFVAKGDGSHYFSSTLEEHQKAVEKYQLSEKNDIH